jgi:hypothetical protein
MTELYPTNSPQTMTEPFSTTLPVIDASERGPIEPESESGPRVGKTSHVNWAMLAIWSFAVFSFAALLFCIFIMFAKCHSD